MWDCENKKVEENWPLLDSKKEKIENHEENKLRKWEEKYLRMQKMWNNQRENQMKKKKICPKK